MPVVNRTEARLTTTPNATMTTFASPTQGGSGLAVWQVTMEPGASGPPHTFDVEQVWAVLDGAAVVQLDGAEHRVEPGDTVVMPAGLPRRIHADTGFTALVAAPAGAMATGPDGNPVLPPWIA